MYVCIYTYIYIYIYMYVYTHIHMEEGQPAGGVQHSTHHLYGSHEE